MIICPTHRFVFVHIPKCAGTSIRSQIVVCDPRHVAMARVGRHPVLGTIDYGHVPLDQLRMHFPNEYAALRSFDSFAVLRDPLARFGSALRQVLWQYEKRPMTLIPQAELRETTLRTLDRVAAEIDAPSHPYIFFMRQDRFVFDWNERVTQHLVPLEMVSDFIGYLSRRTGTPMETGARANQNVDLKVKGRLGKIAFGVNDALRRRLPGPLHALLKDTALKVLATRKSAAEVSGVLKIPEVRDFVAEYYARDTELHNAALRDGPALSAAFREARLPDSSSIRKADLTPG